MRNRPLKVEGIYTLRLPSLTPKDNRRLIARFRSDRLCVGRQVLLSLERALTTADEVLPNKPLAPDIGCCCDSFTAQLCDAGAHGPTEPSYLRRVLQQCGACDNISDGTREGRSKRLGHKRALAKSLGAC